MGLVLTSVQSVSKKIVLLVFFTNYFTYHFTGKEEVSELLLALSTVVQ